MLRKKGIYSCKQRAALPPATSAERLRRAAQKLRTQIPAPDNARATRIEIENADTSFR